MVKSNKGKFYGVTLFTFLFILGNSITQPLRPLYISKVGASPEQLGIILALPFIVSLLTRVPSSIITNFFGRGKMLFFSLFLSFSTLIMFVFIYTPLWFFPVVSLSALAWAIFSPIAINIVSDFSTDTSRGRIMGIYYSGMGAALFIGPLISSLLTLRYSIRDLFYFSSTFPLLAIILFLYYDFFNKIKEDDYTEEQNTGKKEYLNLYLFKNKFFMSLCIARIFYAISMNIFSALFPLYAEGSLKLTPSIISLLFTIRGLSNLLIRFPSGRLSDNIGREKPFYFAYILLILIFILLGLTNNIYLIAVLMIFFGIGWGMRVAPSTALIAESTNLQERNIALALYMTMWDAGSGIGNLLAGFFADYFGFKNLLFLSAIIMMVGLSLVIYVKQSSS